MAAKRPNVLLIVADDLGFSDTSPFGGEIQTPSLDMLAASGVRLTNFHTASMCSPTRAMLLSGTDNHIAGLGQMAFWTDGRDPVPWENRAGYEGYLNFRVAALPEILQDAGYHTCMSGKWHLGLRPELAPAARGFDRSFALLPGGSNHYNYEPRHPDGRRIFSHWASLYHDGKRQIDSATELPKDFYSSDYFATRLLGYLEERQGDTNLRDKPFFAFLPFTAPHWPLQAPEESMRRYAGVYDDGPDVLRTRRIARQVELNLCSADTEPHPVVAGTKKWADMTIEERRWSARTMEAYAGMVDRLDYNVGRVMDAIKATGEWDNTLVVFMSDNGAEGSVLEAIPMTGDVIKRAIDKEYNNETDNLGNRDSFIWYGPRWAQAATAPSRLHKGYVTEGGIRCPAIVHYPPLTGRSRGRISDAFVTVMDILPTILDLARVPLPGSTFRGREVVLVKGKSWLPLLREQVEQVHDENTVIGWELFFHQAIRKGKWKAVFIPKPKGPERWQLFDMDKDRGEIHNLAEQEPEILDQLVKYWLAYVAEFGVFLREELENNSVP